MQLGYTILYGPYVSAALKFYEAAFGLTTRFRRLSWRHIRYCFYSCLRTLHKRYSPF